MGVGCLMEALFEWLGENSSRKEFFVITKNCSNKFFCNIQKNLYIMKVKQDYDWLQYDLLMVPSHWSCLCDQ